MSQESTTGGVMVVDANRQFVGYVHWAVARKALKEKRARVWRKSPLAIMLSVGETTLPAFKTAASSRSTTMTTTNQNLNDMRGPSVMNWLKFFQDERDIWVQNTSNTQLSMQFEIAPGQAHGVLIPIGNDPICITQEVPWDAIKKSMDFRKFLNKVPAVMRIMNEDQVHNHYSVKAQQLNAYVTDPETGKPVPNVTAAVQHAEQERKRATSRGVSGDDTVVSANGQVTFSPPRSAQELMNVAGDPNAGHMGVPAAAAQAAGLSHVPAGFQGQPGAGGMPTGFPQQAAFSPQNAGFANVGDGAVMVDQIVNPRILNLCQQVSMQIPANLRMPAEQFFRELQGVGTMSMEDLQYVESHGTYATVKKWARRLQQEREAAAQGDGLEDGLTMPETAQAPTL